MKELQSPLAGRAWRCLMLSLAGLLLATLVLFLHLGPGLLPAGATQWAAGLLVTAGWVMAVRFLLLDTWGRWFWVAVLAGALALVLFAGTTGLGFGIALSATMLLSRFYKPWRHISDRRRALGFGLGLVALVLLVINQRLWSVPAESAAALVMRNLGIWSVWSLLIFWAVSLFNLAVRMRLHFLRLRPKLAVSAFLIGVLPLLLMVLLGGIVLYTTLGGSRAARLNNTLDSWRDMTAAGVDMSGALFDTTFVWPEVELAARPDVTVLPAPDWAAKLGQAMRTVVANEARVSRDSTEVTTRSDSTDYFMAGDRIWLMSWHDLDTDQPRVQAWQLGERPLRKLSQILKAGLDLTATASNTANGGLVIDVDSDVSELAGFSQRSVSYRDTTGIETKHWSKYLYFGGTFREMLFLSEEKIGQATMFIQLRVGWQDLSAEYVSDGANLNVLVVAMIGIATLLWLVFEVFAVFFGVRISEGIVTGVHALHRGTRAVAAGDLDTVIEIPNEDEFGDLARSFNGMTAAVRHGREIALANDRLKQEMETARAIQIRLLPSTEPRLLDFEIAGASIPSREIGGDYYDFLAQADDKIGIAIGDVSGKGMPAALLMSNLQASLHGQVLHPGSVSGVVSRVNDLLVRSTDSHMFATFFYGLLDAASATFTCTNAGHNPPLLLRNDGSIDELTTGGLLLGMLGDQPYKQDTVTLAPGEVIVLYTDGITEAVGPSAEEDDPEAMFGEEALYEVMRQSRQLPATAIKDAILAAVTAHTLGVAQSDDITLVVIRRQG